MSRYGETVVNNWVRMQRATWDSNAGSVATRFVLENAAGDQVAEWPAKLENVEEIIQDSLTMHAGELPIGNHAFRLVAYSDAKAQLGELPQTLRGRSKEATSAASELIQMAKAMALMLSNTQQMFALQHQQFEAQEKRLGDQYENVALLIDRNAENASNNLEAQLRLEQFHNEQSRRDKREEAILSIITPIGVMAAEKYGPKLLQMSPAEIGGKVKEMFGAESKLKGEPVPSAEPTPEPIPEPETVPITKADLAGIGQLLQTLVGRLEVLELNAAQVGQEGPPNDTAARTPVEPVRLADSEVSEPRPTGVQRTIKQGAREVLGVTLQAVGNKLRRDPENPNQQQKNKASEPMSNPQIFTVGDAPILYQRLSPSGPIISNGTASAFTQNDGITSTSTRRAWLYQGFVSGGGAVQVPGTAAADLDGLGAGLALYMFRTYRVHL